MGDHQQVVDNAPVPENRDDDADGDDDEDDDDDAPAAGAPAAGAHPTFEALFAMAKALVAVNAMNGVALMVLPIAALGGLLFSMMAYRGMYNVAECLLSDAPPLAVPPWNWCERLRTEYFNYPMPARVALFDPPHVPVDGRTYVYVRGVKRLYATGRHVSRTQFASPELLCDAISGDANAISLYANIPFAMDRPGNTSALTVFSFNTATTGSASFILDRATGRVVNALHVAHLWTDPDNPTQVRGYDYITSIWEHEARAATGHRGIYCLTRLFIHSWINHLELKDPLTQAVADAIRTEGVVAVEA